MKDLIMYKEETRRILTRLHGKIQYDILASVLGQLSDGRWQNSPRMEMYWRNASVVLDNGYDVVLEVKKHALPYCAMSDADILKWFGKKIKQLIKEEFGNSREVWSRTNTKQKTDYLSHRYPSQTSVAECYYVYDTLMGRDTDNKVYRMESVFNKLMGKKVIKESLNDEQLKQAVTTIVNKTNLPKNINKQQVIEDVYDLILGKDFETQQELDEALTDYLKKTYGTVSQSIDDREISKAIQQAVYDFDWQDVEYDDVDVIAEFEANLYGGNFKDEYQVEKIVTDYLNKHYREFAYQSVKPSKKRKVIKEDSFDSIAWDYNAKPKTLDEVIATLQKAREELGNLEVGVQFRDEGGEFYGYDANLYFWYDKKTNTFVL